MIIIKGLMNVQKLSILLFLCLFFSSNFFLINIGESDRTLPYNAAIIATSLIFIVFSLNRIIINKLVKVPVLAKYMFFAFFVMVSPLLFMKTDIVEFIPRILMLVGTLTLFVSFYQMPDRNPVHLLWSIALIGACQVIWGGYQVIIAAQVRPYGIFQQVNVYGSFLATAFIISGFLATRTNGTFKITFLALLSVSSLYLIYLTGSRTAMLSVAVAGLMLLPILVRNFIHNAVKVWVFAALIGVAAISWSALDVSSYLSSTQRLESSESIPGSLLEKSGREYIYPQVLKLAFDNFWTGTGFERFAFEYLNRTAEWYHNGEFETYGLYNLDYPHSEVLYWFSEGGIVSLFGILGVIVLILTQVSRTPKGWRLAFLSLILPISLHTLLEYPLYHSQIHLVVLITLIYIINVYSRERVLRIRFKLSVALVRVIQVLLVCFSITYISTISYANLLMKDFAASQDKNPEQLSFLHDNWLLGLRYERHFQTKLITYAINNRSESKVKEYINWAEKSILKQPFLSEYRFLIFAYNAVGDEKKAKEIQARASYLFPKFEIEKRVFKVPQVVKGT